MIKARTLAAALLGLACLTSSAVAQKAQVSSSK